MDAMAVHPRRALVAVVIALATTLVAACGSGSSPSRPDVATTVPQTPLAAPPLGTQAPSGTVVPAPASSSIVLDEQGRRLAVLGTDRTSVAVY